MTADQDLTSLIQSDCAQVAGANPLCGPDLLSDLRGDCLLVTGGTGFVGTWMAEMVAYLNDFHGFEMQLILASDHAYEFANRAPHLANRSDVSLLEQDARAMQELPSQVNWIVHAAGTPDNRIHSSDPLRTFQVIVQGTNAVLAGATRLPNLKRFLNLSSGLVYGAQPLTLDAMPETFCGTHSANLVAGLYAEAKRAAETLCAAYRTQHRLSIVNARPFAFVGPYQLLNRPWAINNFIRDAILGVPIRIMGDGETVRSYMYPSDMTWWFLHILVRGENGQNYNVGSSHGVTLNELAEKIASNVAKSPKIMLKTAGDAHLRRSRFIPDTSLAENNLKLSIQVDLTTALSRTISWNQKTQ